MPRCGLCTRKRLVHQQPSRAQRRLQNGKQRPVEIVHDDDDVERGDGKRYSVGFQIHDLCAQRNSAVRSGLANSHNCRQVSIESQGVEAAGRKP